MSTNNPNDNVAGSEQPLEPWGYGNDQPVRCYPQIQDGLPGFVFAWADGRTRGIFLSPHHGPCREWADPSVTVYLTAISPPGDALKFDPEEPDVEYVESIDLDPGCGFT